MSVVHPQPFLTTGKPSFVARAFPLTVHHQLRDSLLICPRETGVVNYVVRGGIVEQDLASPGAPLRVISQLTFTPTSITALPVHGGTLIAAGGLNSEIYLSLHVPMEPTESSGDSRHVRVQWETEYPHINDQINNSVLLTSAINLSSSNQSSVEPRLLVSNNDFSTRFYDVSLLNPEGDRLHEIGGIVHDVPVNYSSVSPDGRTLVSVCDSHDIHIHDIKGGGLLSFEATAKLEMPHSDAAPLSYPLSSFNSLSSPLFSSACRPVYSPWTYPDERSIASPLRYAEQKACFSVAFTQDGSKFAVASQQGAVAVWDVKKLSEPLKVFHTSKMRSMGHGGRSGDSGHASGWLTDPWGWIFDHGGFGPLRTPEWSVRSVKFSSGEGRHEIMAFTEHTSLVHIVDALTFEEHETIAVPTLVHPLPSQNSFALDDTLEGHKYYEDLELAGVCFDPQGKTMYTAGAGYGIPSVIDSWQGPGVLRVGAVAAWDLRSDSGPSI